MVGKNGCVVACSHPIKISQPKRDAWLTINDGKQNAVCNPVIFEWAQHNNHNGMPTDDNEMNIRETAQIIKAADYAFPGAKLTFIRRKITNHLCRKVKYKCSRKRANVAINILEYKDNTINVAIKFT